jgi:hypothetical protein
MKIHTLLLLGFFFAAGTIHASPRSDYSQVVAQWKKESNFEKRQALEKKLEEIKLKILAEKKARK